jgi:hypothetical protein
MTRYLALATLLLAVLVRVSSAFQPPPQGSPASMLRLVGAQTAQCHVRSPTLLHSSKGDKKKKGAFDEGLRTKLVSESIAPWRTLRLFLYGALGSGAAVGGFITLAGTLAAASGARTDLDMNTEVSLSSSSIFRSVHSISGKLFLNDDHSY